MKEKAQINVTPKAKWTVMVYMAGDNNLDGAALRDIAEMAQVGSTKDVNVLVQLDRLEDKLTRRFRITKGGGYAKDCLEKFGETDTGDPQILYEFICWSVEKYPADRYILILWNHGSGWWEDAKSRGLALSLKASQPLRRPYQPLFYRRSTNAHRSICYDDTSDGDALDNKELKGVLTQACTLMGKKLDILGMDACLMNMVEVAYQLRDSVGTIVGSEIEEPFDGWPYTDILAYLTSKPKKDTAALAKEIARRYVTSYKGMDETITQSALDVIHICGLPEKIDALSTALLSAVDTDSKVIKTAWSKSPKFYDDSYIDLACFARNLKKKGNADVRAKADNLLSALKAGKDKAILYQGKIGKEVNGTCGLSIYFPADSINPAYNHLDFTEDCKWITFLERFLS